MSRHEFDCTSDAVVIHEVSLMSSSMLLYDVFVHEMCKNMVSVLTNNITTLIDSQLLKPYKMQVMSTRFGGSTNYTETLQFCCM